MRIPTVAILTSLALLAPTAIASHFDPDNGVGLTHTTLGQAWNTPPTIDLKVEWAGIGGEGGSIHRTGTGGIGSDELSTLGTHPGPDDCADIDEPDAVPYVYFFDPTPSVALRPPASEGTVLEEQSVSAPAEVESLCRAIREIAWAQDPNHPWATPGDQKIGIGRVSYVFDWVIVYHGVFNSAFRADPGAGVFKATTCPITGPVFTDGRGSDGTRPNSQVAGALNPDDCMDHTAQFLETIVGRGAGWDAGSINEFSGVLGTAYFLNGVSRDPFEDFSAEDWAPGLYVMCLRSTIRDLSQGIDHGYEDYAWMWIDETPFLLSPSYVDPASWDTRGSGYHCTDVNPNFPA